MEKGYYLVKISSINNKVLNLFKEFFKKVLNKLNVKYSFFILPKKRKKFSLLKSPHNYKKAIENFEFIKHKAICVIEKRIKKSFFLFIALNKPKQLKINFSFKS